MEWVILVWVRVEWVMMEGGKPTGCVLTYVRTYVRAYVRYVVTHVKTYVRTSIPKAYIQNGHKLTRVRTCVFSGSEASKLLANLFQKAST